MKANKYSRDDYGRLRMKIFFQVVATLGVAFCSIYILIFSVLRGHLGNWFVEMFQTVLGMDYQSAYQFYQQAIRNNIRMFLVIAVVLMFFLLLYILLHWVTKYFHTIDQGIDDLLSSDGKEITLSPDLQAIERKLNTVRQTLEKRALEAQLAEQRKNELIMYLAHDIRTPLTSVIGYLSLLDEAPDMPPEQKAKYVHITLDKAYRLEKLINEFFEITRYNLQQIQLEKESIDLQYMLIQMAEELYPVFSANGNTVALHVEENLMVFGDPARLARVFNNVLKNAAAYSFSGTEIQITANVQEEMVVITIQNQGATIPKEKLTSIFDKFYRLDDARTSNTGGAGLGLAISKEIVSLHGGTISADSQNSHSTFTVMLPAQQK